MDLDDDSLFDAAVSVVARYGMKRTTMADLARAAGVSRQTLYDRFGDKDGVMAAVIDNMADRIARDLRASFEERSDLTDKLDAYFEIAVRPMYELMQTMPDAVDFERGMGATSNTASRKASELKQAVLAEMLRLHLPPETQPSRDVAAFIEQSSGRAKMSGISRDELERFLLVLKTSVAALARKS